MRLSKIYRPDDEKLERLQLLSFDTPEGLAVKPGYRSSHQFQQVAPCTDSCGTVDEGEPTPEPLVETMAVQAPAAQPAVDLETVHEEARQQGYQDGLTAGEAKLEQASRALSDALAEIQHLRESVLINSRQDMLNLVMTIAEQLVQQELTLKADAILPVVERALKSAVRSENMRVKVHPGDLETVTEHKPLFLASVSGLTAISFEADASMTPGGCKIESDLGEVDATLETQLEEIRSALADAMGDL